MADFLFTFVCVFVVLWLSPKQQTFDPHLYDEAVSKCEVNQGVKKIKLSDYENKVYCNNDASFTLKTKKED